LSWYPPMPTRIDLAEFRKPATARVFSGRPRGEAVRLAANLPRLETAGETFEIHIPDNVIGITASFFLGMFGDSIQALGEDQFRARYRFTGKDVSMVIDDGIKDALKSTSALSSLVDAK
jgi:hypothetical protein